MGQFAVGDIGSRHTTLGTTTVAWQAASWLAYGVVRFAAASWGYAPTEMPVMAASTAIRVVAGFVVALLFGAILSQLAARVGHRVLVVASVTVAVPASIVWYVLDRSLLVTFAAIAGVVIPWRNWPRGLEVEYSLVMMIWGVAYAVTHLRASTHELEHRVLAAALDARAAQVRALGWQINPHFLFNTLNALRSLVVEDAGRARSTITQLSKLLRYSLQAPAGGLVPLAAELDAVESYVGIQQARFEREIEITLAVADAARACLVPVFLLQPLVENAIEHGGLPGEPTRRVGVDAMVAGRTLVITVANPGELRSLMGARAGVGLSNVMDRLETIYGEAARFEIGERGGQVRAVVQLPAVPATLG